MRGYSILGASPSFNQYYSQISNPLVDFIQVLNLYFLNIPWCSIRGTNWYTLDVRLEKQTDKSFNFFEMNLCSVE